MTDLAGYPPGGDAACAPAELQQLIADQTQRAEKHRANYQALKSQHGRVQDELAAAQTELALLRAERQSAAEKFQQLVAQSRRDIHAKDQLIGELQAQIPSREQLEYRQLQTREEVKAQMRDKLLKAEEELEELRSEAQELKYQRSCLTTESEQLRQQHSRELQELHVRHQVQLAELEAQRDQLRAFKMVGEEELTTRLLPVQKENAALQLRLRGQLAELQEARAQAEAAQAERTALQAGLERRQAEMTVALRVSETERVQLSSRAESGRQQQAELQSRLAAAELQLQREASRAAQLAGRLADSEQHNKRQVADLQLEVCRTRGEADRDKAAALRHTQELEHRLSLSDEKVAALETAAADAERQLERRVAQARDREWNNTRALRQQLLEVETRLQESQQESLHAVNEKAELAKQCEQRIAEVLDMKKRLEADLAVLRTKMKTYGEMCSDLEEQKDNVSKLRQELNAERSIVTELSREMKQIQEEKTDVEKELDGRLEELRTLERSGAERLQQSQQQLAARQQEGAEERRRLQERLEQLEKRRLQAQQERDDVQGKTHKYARLIGKLRRRLELCQAETQQLAAERDAFSRCVPEHTYNELRKQHRALQRKQREFAGMLQSLGGPDVSAGLAAQLQLLQARLGAAHLDSADGGPCTPAPALSPRRPRYRRSPSRPAGSGAPYRSTLVTDTDGTG